MEETARAATPRTTRVHGAHWSTVRTPRHRNRAHTVRHTTHDTLSTPIACELPPRAPHFPYMYMLYIHPPTESETSTSVTAATALHLCAHGAPSAHLERTHPRIIEFITAERPRTHTYQLIQPQRWRTCNIVNSSSSSSASSLARLVPWRRAPPSMKRPLHETTTYLGPTKKPPTSWPRAVECRGIIEAFKTHKPCEARSLRSLMSRASARAASFG